MLGNVFPTFLVTCFTHSDFVLILTKILSLKEKLGTSLNKKNFTHYRRFVHNIGNDVFYDKESGIFYHI